MHLKWGLSRDPRHFRTRSNGRQYLVSGGGNGGTIDALEASHYYPLNDRLALIPAFYAIFNANTFDSNPKLYVGNLRAQFSF